MAADKPKREEADLSRRLSFDVQMQCMRPGQLEAAGRKFPVVYVPFGLIEWHGRHLPLGTDAIKAHAILVKTAGKFGGVVYPPVFFPYARYAKGNFQERDMEFKVPLLTALFERLKATGFRVILGVSGHNIPEQIEMINRALAPVIADGTVAGVGMWEAGKGTGAASDHGAKWETSNMMFFYPETVDMSALGDGPLNLDMKPPSGIGGLDPRQHASADVGCKNVEAAAEAIGRKAQELLQSLSEEHRAFNLKAVSPEHWWQV